MQRSFAELGAEVAERGLHGKVSGVLLDLGVSSPQLDDPERGFSFLNDGPLDMRMNPAQGISAAEFIATAPVEEIARVFKEYGEERFAGRMARAVVERREKEPFTRTADLAEVLKVANPAWEKARTRLPVPSRAFAFTSTTNWVTWKPASRPRSMPSKSVAAWR